jgi:hypothetical protein
MSENEDEDGEGARRGAMAGKRGQRQQRGGRREEGGDDMGSYFDWGDDGLFIPRMPERADDAAFSTDRVLVGDDLPLRVNKLLWRRLRLKARDMDQHVPVAWRRSKALREGMATARLVSQPSSSSSSVEATAATEAGDGGGGDGERSAGAGAGRAEARRLNAAQTVEDIERELGRLIVEGKLDQQLAGGVGGGHPLDGSRAMRAAAAAAAAAAAPASKRGKKVGGKGEGKEDSCSSGEDSSSDEEDAAATATAAAVDKREKDREGRNNRRGAARGGRGAEGVASNGGGDDEYEDEDEDEEEEEDEFAHLDDWSRIHAQDLEEALGDEIPTMDRQEEGFEAFREYAEQLIEAGGVVEYRSTLADELDREVRLPLPLSTARALRESLQQDQEALGKAAQLVLGGEDAKGGNQKPPQYDAAKAFAWLALSQNPGLGETRRKELSEAMATALQRLQEQPNRLERMRARAQAGGGAGGGAGGAGKAKAAAKAGGGGGGGKAKGK